MQTMRRRALPAAPPTPGPEPGPRPGERQQAPAPGPEQKDDPPALLPALAGACWRMPGEGRVWWEEATTGSRQRD